VQSWELSDENAAYGAASTMDKDDSMTTQLHPKTRPTANAENAALHAATPPTATNQLLLYLALVPLALVAYQHLLVTGMVLTACDVLVDPLASGPNALAWVWEHGGAYYGVPTQNFVGWMLTGFTAIVCYRLYERRFRSRPLGQQTRTMLALPLVVYGLDRRVCHCPMSRPQNALAKASHNRAMFSRIRTSRTGI
jgi:hypothetical protein